MKLKLGKKTYDTGALKGSVLWESMEFEDLLKKETTPLKQLNMMAENVIKLYGNQFTIEDIQDGLSADEVWATLNSQCFGVGIKLQEKIQPKNE